MHHEEVNTEKDCVLETAEWQNLKGLAGSHKRVNILVLVFSQSCPSLLVWPLTELICRVRPEELAGSLRGFWGHGKFCWEVRNTQKSLESAAVANSGVRCLTLVSACSLLQMFKDEESVTHFPTSATTHKYLFWKNKFFQSVDGNVSEEQLSSSV